MNSRNDKKTPLLFDKEVVLNLNDDKELSEKEMRAVNGGCADDAPGGGCGYSVDYCEFV